MKNKLTAIFISILMCLSLCSLFPVSAEETTTAPEETTEVTTTETTTAANGFEDYTFEEFVALTPEKIGEISALDVLLLNKYVAQAVTFNNDQIYLADCIGDHQINNDDATALLRYVVELDPELPTA